MHHPSTLSPRGPDWHSTAHRLRLHRVIIALAALGMATGGCAFKDSNRVMIRTEGSSVGNIRVSAPRVYRDQEHYVATGWLAKTGLGFSTSSPGHLHAQLVDASGGIVKEEVIRAPNIRRNRFAASSSAYYSARMDELPPTNGMLRIVYHRGPRSACCPKQP